METEVSAPDQPAQVCIVYSFYHVLFVSLTCAFYFKCKKWKMKNKGKRKSRKRYVNGSRKRGCRGDVRNRAQKLRRFERVRSEQIGSVASISASDPDDPLVVDLRTRTTLSYHPVLHQSKSLIRIIVLGFDSWMKFLRRFWTFACVISILVKGKFPLSCVRAV